MLETFFIKLIKPDHPAVYQYIRGGVRSKNSAIIRITKEVYGWCDPYWMGDDSFTLEYTRGIARLYLAFLEHEYNEGNINLKEIYQNDYESK